MIVTFRSSAFNTYHREKYFVTSRAYGSDVANWLLNELNRRETRAEATIGQKNHGWTIQFRFRGATYEFLVLYRDPEWIGSLERKRSIIDRLLRKQRKSVEPDAVLLVNSVLSSSELVHDIRWEAGYGHQNQLPDW